tara:strand:+ start:1738 stop:4410 length:2673 start_codon:yes stop_codon:yes gene_type:complete
MDIEVKPKNWILENRIGYNKKINNTFNRSKYKDTNKKENCKCKSDNCDIDVKTISLFPHQRILRDYIQLDSPYRGILAYHELGSGKSAASIAAAEIFMEKRKIFVLTPASLAKNYENELMKISTLGLNMKKTWTLLKITGDLKSKTLIEKLIEYGINIKYIKKDKQIWLPLYKNDLNDYASVIENDVTYSSLKSDKKKIIDDIILHIIRNKYKFISYNGLTQKMLTEMGKDIFNNSFIIVDEVHNFISRVVNGSKIARTVYNNMMNADNCKLVLLSGTPIINNPYEIASLINLLRGPMEIFKIKLLSSSIDVSDKILKEKINELNINKFIDYIYYNNREISIALLPEGYIKESKSIEIVKYKWEYTKDKLIEIIKSELENIKGLKIGIKKTKELYYALPNNKDDFDKMFIDYKDEEKPVTKNLDLFQRRILGTVSYYRTSGSEFFPELLPIKIQYLNMSNHQLTKYDEVRSKERKIDEAKKFRKNDMDEKSSVYRAYSRMVCNFAFPENLERVYPSDIKNILRKELDIVAEDNINEEIVVNNDYENKLDKVIKELDTNEYLSKENLKNYYSPKYSKMLDDIEESPGSVLIYSQFRMVEGLGIFSKSLNYNDYKEIILIKSENGYKYSDLSVFDEKYDNKRYIVFNSDKEKTNQLIHLFNGEFSQLNGELYNSLPDRIKKNKDIQLYGKLVKVLMITQSGAEGISLKNVRRVLIMEYFWNSVRINQVIGRAVRTCSHQQLPLKDRNVQVYSYIMKLTQEQLKKNFTIKTMDKGITTDEYIYNIAKNKEELINSFLKLLKASSFDCVINSEKNKPLESGYKCYNWPINVNNKKLSFTKDINKDNKILEFQKYTKLKKGKGKVVLIKNKKYVELNNKYYDYNSYINSGILLPV